MLKATILPKYTASMENNTVDTKFIANSVNFESSSNLKDSYPNVDNVVKAPNIPIVRNILVSSLNKPWYSERYIIKPKKKLPIVFIVNVPTGKLTKPFCIHPPNVYLRIAPIKPPIPTSKIVYKLKPQ